MRKFLFVSSNEWAKWGGSEVLWAQAAERLRQKGFAISISVKGWEEPVAQIEHLRAIGCEVSCRRPPSLARKIADRALGKHDRFGPYLQSLADDADLVVISQGMNGDGLDWMEAAKGLGLRYVIVAQAAAEYVWPVDDVAKRLADCYESAVASYFVSLGNLELSRRQLVSPLSNARVIRNPFNVSYNARPAWPSQAAEDQLLLACVARVDVGTKGHDILCQVLALPRWRGRKVQVSVVGRGLNEQRLRRFVQILNLPNVVFSGFADNVEKVWSEHHALVLPSRHEGMPLAVVEAMLCGRPCIVTDVGGNRELVRDNVNGFLAKAPTVELLDEAMNRAWENRHRLREMGEQAARDVRQWVGPDPVGDFVEELIALAERN